MVRTLTPFGRMDYSHSTPDEGSFYRAFFAKLKVGDVFPYSHGFLLETVREIAAKNGYVIVGCDRNSVDYKKHGGFAVEIIGRVGEVEAIPTRKVHKLNVFGTLEYSYSTPDEKTYRRKFFAKLNVGDVFTYSSGFMYQEVVGFAREHGFSIEVHSDVRGDFAAKITGRMSQETQDYAANIYQMIQAERRERHQQAWL